MNLGSPDSTATSDVKKYLNQFLMDERVIDIPYLLRLLLIEKICSREHNWYRALPFRLQKFCQLRFHFWLHKLLVNHFSLSIQKFIHEPPPEAGVGQIRDIAADIVHTILHDCVSNADFGVSVPSNDFQEECTVHLIVYCQNRVTIKLTSI